MAHETAQDGLKAIPQDKKENRQMMRSLTMLNESGDTTISWTEDLDSEIEKIIKKKMAEGVTFFIIEREHGARMKLEKPKDARKYRALAIPDDDLRKFVESGAAVADDTPSEPIKNSRISRDAKEVAKGKSVGVQPRRGG
jgi:hypothetical protein